MNKKIAIIDDEQDILDILEKFLSRSEKFDIVTFTNPKVGLEALRTGSFDLVLLDIMMPQMSGLDVLKEIKKDNLNVKAIMMTAYSTLDKVIESNKTGAEDYVTKPFRSIELLARVKTHLKLSQTINELNHLASHDVMTNIYNRRKFFELGENLCKKQDDNTYVVMVDIDKFKNVNDTYGHPFGDVVIKLLASTVSENLPPELIFGRIGGEEFAIIGLMDSSNKVSQIIENIRKIVESLEPKTEDGQIVKFTISSGIAVIKENDTLDSILKSSDDALYEAKDTGRNKTCFRV